MEEVLETIVQRIRENEESQGLLAQTLTELGIPVTDVNLAKDPSRPERRLDLATLASQQGNLEVACAVRFRLACIMNNKAETTTTSFDFNGDLNAIDPTLVASYNITFTDDVTRYKSVGEMGDNTHLIAASKFATQLSVLSNLHTKILSVTKTTGSFSRKQVPTVTMIDVNKYVLAAQDGNTKLNFDYYVPDIVVLCNVFAAAKKTEKILAEPQFQGYIRLGPLEQTTLRKKTIDAMIVLYRPKTVEMLASPASTELKSLKIPVWLLDFRYRGEPLVEPDTPLYRLVVPESKKDARNILDKKLVKVKTVPKTGARVVEWVGESPLLEDTVIGVYEGLLTTNRILINGSSFSEPGSVKNKESGDETTVWVDARDPRFSNWTRDIRKNPELDSANVTFRKNFDVKVIKKIRKGEEITST